MRATAGTSCSGRPQTGRSAGGVEREIRRVRVLLRGLAPKRQPGVPAARSFAGSCGEISMRASGVADIGSSSLTQVGERVWRERPGGYHSWERSTHNRYRAGLLALGHGRGLAVGREDQQRTHRRPGPRVSPGDYPWGCRFENPPKWSRSSTQTTGWVPPTGPFRGILSLEERPHHRSRRKKATLTICSLTRASETWQWRATYPLPLAAQAVARRRYLRALRGVAK